MTPRHFAWQAWHLVTSTFVWRGRRGTISHPPSFCVAGVALLALGGALGSVFVAGDAAALCVAGVALGDIYLRLAWQAWHNLTSTFVLRGRRGTIFDTPSFTHRFVTPSFTHHFVTHHFVTHHFVTRHLSPHHLPHTTLSPHHFSHTTLSHTIFDTPSLTHHFVTHHL